MSYEHVVIAAFIVGTVVTLTLVAIPMLTIDRHLRDAHKRLRELDHQENRNE